MYLINGQKIIFSHVWFWYMLCLVKRIHDQISLIWLSTCALCHFHAHFQVRTGQCVVHCRDITGKLFYVEESERCLNIGFHSYDIWYRIYRSYWGAHVIIWIANVHWHLLIYVMEGDTRCSVIFPNPNDIGYS